MPDSDRKLAAAASGRRQEARGLLLFAAFFSADAYSFRNVKEENDAFSGAGGSDVPWLASASTTISTLLAIGCGPKSSEAFIASGTVYMMRAKQRAAARSCERSALLRSALR